MERQTDKIILMLETLQHNKPQLAPVIETIRDEVVKLQATLVLKGVDL